MLNNYDRIAPYYDRLSRMIFLKSQVNAQIDQLKYLPHQGRVLIVGGGTGWILEEIAKVKPEGLKITYVEIAEKMIDLAKKRNLGENEVLFFHSGIEDFDTAQDFDVILTPFLFDNFEHERAMFVFEKLDNCLVKSGLWFWVDFSTSGSGGWWKHALLKTMYGFFRLIKMVEANHLVDITPFFLQRDYKQIQTKHYYGDFIKAVIYQK